MTVPRRLFVYFLPVNRGRAFTFWDFDERLVTAVFKPTRILDSLLGFFYGSVSICFILCSSRRTIRDDPFERHGVKNLAVRRRTFSHLVELLDYIQRLVPTNDFLFIIANELLPVFLVQNLLF